MSGIKVGDLVVVTKPTPCCKSTKSLGKIFTVKEINPLSSRKTGYCKRCFFEWQHGSLGDEVKATDGRFFLLSRLTRIDPLPESETQDNHESIPA